MAINVDKGLTPGPVNPSDLDIEVIVEPGIMDVGDTMVTETEDGGATVDFDPQAEVAAEGDEHSANLAEIVEVNAGDPAHQRLVEEARKLGAADRERLVRLAELLVLGRLRGQRGLDLLELAAELLGVGSHATPPAARTSSGLCAKY